MKNRIVKVVLIIVTVVVAGIAGMCIPMYNQVKTEDRYLSASTKTEIDAGKSGRELSEVEEKTDRKAIIKLTEKNDKDKEENDNILNAKVANDELVKNNLEGKEIESYVPDEEKGNNKPKNNEDAYDRLEDKETESKGIIDDNIIDNDKSTENVDKLEEEHKETPITTGEEAEMGSLEWIEKKIEENRDYIENEEDIKDFKQIFSKIDYKYIQRLYQDEVTEKEQTEIKSYLHQQLTDYEYQRTKVLLIKYYRLLDE